MNNLKPAKGIILVALTIVPAAGQQRATMSVDLTNPALARNGSLLMNYQGNGPMQEQLQRLIDKQRSAGVVNPTVYQSLKDEDTGLGSYPSVSSLLRDLTCHSDIVVTGTPTQSLSHFSISGTNIYTDYDFVIADVLKNDSTATAGSSLHIVATRPGGIMPVKGGSINYINSMFLPLSSKALYLLFMSYISQSGAYQPTSIAIGSVFSSFQLQPSKSQWYFHRSAYKNQDIPELADSVVRSTVIGTAPVCQQ